MKRCGWSLESIKPAEFLQKYYTVKTDLLKPNIIMSTLIPYKLSQAVTQLSTLFISNTSDIFNHGCWCSKLVHHSKSGLGGRDFIDDLDELCKNWAKARRCLRYSAQSCENTHVEALSKFYEIDENSCVENDDLCLSEACKIDLFYISEIISRNDQGRSFKI